MKTDSIAGVSWPERSPWGHKGTYGRVLIVGGSRGMSGAVALAGKAALRTGSGLVRLAVPDRIVETVSSYQMETVTLPLPNDGSGRISLDAYGHIVEHARWADVVAVGPGLGCSLGLSALLVRLYTTLPRPMVLDADALNALARRNVFTLRKHEFDNRTGCPRILTPHGGEFSRLTAAPVPAEDAGVEAGALRRDAATRFARATETILVLKGHRTLITDGTVLAVNGTGNAGMASGGSGDVLTGMIAALLGQGFSPMEGARVAVHLHGLAGDFAAEELGHESLVAGSILRFLPKAIRDFRRHSGKTATGT